MRRLARRSLPTLHEPHRVLKKHLLNLNRLYQHGIGGSPTKYEFPSIWSSVWNVTYDWKSNVPTWRTHAGPRNPKMHLDQLGADSGLDDLPERKRSLQLVALMRVDRAVHRFPAIIEPTLIQLGALALRIFQRLGLEHA